MKLIICDICGTRISNHSNLSNTATIGGRDIEICNSCREKILNNLIAEKMNYIQKIDEGLANIKSKLNGGVG